MGKKNSGRVVGKPYNDVILEDEIIYKSELESDENQPRDTITTPKPNKISFEGAKGAARILSRHFDEDENFNI